MTRAYLYFAYGSNLLSKRIHMNNPSAKRKCIGILKNYSLDFSHFSKLWQGASATIKPQQGSHVWGAIWEISEADKINLDKQEGVHDNVYFSLEVEIEDSKGSMLTCLTYQLCKLPTGEANLNILPDERKPSSIYLNTIIQGAEESNLPTEYVAALKLIPHNGYSDNELKQLLKI